MVLSQFPCGIKMLCLRQMKLIRQGVSVFGCVFVCESVGLCVCVCVGVLVERSRWANHPVLPFLLVYFI